MGFFIFFGVLFALLYTGAYFAFAFFEKKIGNFEKRLITAFSSRTDSICQLYEVLKPEIAKHEDIFKEIGELRKKEFSLLGISHNIETFVKLQTSIHHEINFIFQVSHKNPKLTKNKKFLYIREHMLEKSSNIKNLIEIYNRIISVYNRCISFKNWTILGLLLPFHKKKIL